MSYPKFYRKATRCIKRETDFYGVEVRVPPPGDTLPIAMEPIAFQSKELFDKDVSTMEQCNADDYQAYVGTFTAAAREVSRKLNEFRQAAFFAGEKR